MSEKRIVLEQECEHGNGLGHHRYLACTHDSPVHDLSSEGGCGIGVCPGGSRRVLIPGTVAEEVGDTFIDFQTVSPSEQWERIFDLLTGDE